MLPHKIPSAEIQPLDSPGGPKQKFRKDTARKLRVRDDVVCIAVSIQFFLSNTSTFTNSLQSQPRCIFHNPLPTSEFRREAQSRILDALSFSLSPAPPFPYVTPPPPLSLAILPKRRVTPALAMSTSRRRGFKLFGGEGGVCEGRVLWGV